MPVYEFDGVAPQLPPAGRFWIAPNATVIGRCIIGEDVGIWFGAVLRGDIEPMTVGARSNIQEHSVLHTDAGFPLSIGADCTIGHRAIIHGCTIGNNTLIGMGATVMNGAVVGNNCLVGAGALIPEGKMIPDGSLVVGMPAKVVRPLEPQHIEELTRSAERYVAKWQHYAGGTFRPVAG